MTMAIDGLSNVIAVAGGGAAGAVARYLIGISPLAKWFGSFPTSTFLINILGSFLIGVVMALTIDRLVISESVKLAIVVGFLGAFTTFSAFEFELLEMIHQRQIALAFGYAVSSVVVGLIGVVAGFELGRRI